MTRRDDEGILSMYRGFPRDVYVLFLARVINSMGNFVYPFLTLMLTDRFEMTPGDAGMILLFITTAYVPGSLMGGRIADRRGRKKLLAASQILSALFFLPCAFLKPSVAMVWLIAGAQFFLGAQVPAMKSLVMDLLPPERRKAGFSFLYLGNNLGLALGPMIAGLLYNRAFAWIFLGDVLTTLAAMFLILLLVRESFRPEYHQALQEGEDASHSEAVRRESLAVLLFRRWNLLLFITGAFFLSLVYSQFSFSVPLKMNALDPARGPEAFGFLMSFNGLLVILLTPVLTFLTKRVSPVRMMMAAALLYGIGFGCFPRFQTLFWFFPAVFIWTMGEIAGAVNNSVYLASHTPRSHRGRMNALFPILTGSGYAYGPVFFGHRIDRMGFSSLGPVLALFCCIGFFCFGGVLVHDRIALIRKGGAVSGD